jgi:hypothetical protein
MFILSALMLKAQQEPIEIEETSGRTDEPNVIRHVVPFLTITPDSRAGALGDAGAATKPDINSIYWNPAKYTFMEDQAGLSLSYTPWLKALGANIYLGNLAGYLKIDDLQSVGFSLYYFNLGEITLTSPDGTVLDTDTPNELSFNAAYSRKFSENIGGSVGLKYIVSRIFSNSANASSDGREYIPGRSVAADISVYYEDEVNLGDKNGEMAFGMNISNIGTKMTYTEGGEKSFIPTNLRLGGRLTTNIDEFNSFSIIGDINKLLVPTPDPDKGVDQFNDVSLVEGMFRSFGDAPGGFQEEMREIMFSLGAEWWYSDQFAIRGGMYHEHATKGNRKYGTVGVGLKLNMLSLDFAYLLPFGSNSPLKDTLRLTLGLNIN